MRLRPHDKIGVALAVLRNIKLSAKDVNVDTYSNCREQGFFVTSYCNDKRILNRRAVSFSEHRRSDNIIVQFGCENDFNAYGVLSEEKYPKNVKHFSVGEHEKAGKFARKWLVG